MKKKVFTWLKSYDLNLLTALLIPVRRRMQQIEKYVKENYKGNLHHGWPHLKRVKKYVKKICAKEGGDVELIEIAALFHDAAKIKYGNFVKNHAQKSAEIARKYLKSIGMKEESEEVYDIIKTHSRREKPDPKTLNQKILYDADGLELIGAVGLMRTALDAAYYHKTWWDMVKKMENRLEMKDLFYTKTAKNLARKRLKLLKNVLQQLKKELDFKKPKT